MALSTVKINVARTRRLHWFLLVEDDDDDDEEEEEGEGAKARAL